MNNNISIGDQVVVTDYGKIYTTFDRLALELGVIDTYDYNKYPSIVNGSIIGTVTHISSLHNIAAINVMDKHYLYNLDGLERYYQHNDSNSNTPSIDNDSIDPEFLNLLNRIEIFS